MGLRQRGVGCGCSSGLAMRQVPGGRGVVLRAACGRGLLCQAAVISCGVHGPFRALPGWGALHLARCLCSRPNHAAESPSWEGVLPLACKALLDTAVMPRSRSVLGTSPWLSPAAPMPPLGWHCTPGSCACLPAWCPQSSQQSHSVPVRLQSVLPLLHPLLQKVPSKFFTAQTLAVALALHPAMMHAWLVQHVANANFAFAACVLLAAWQVSA